MMDELSNPCVKYKLNFCPSLVIQIIYSLVLFCFNNGVEKDFSKLNKKINSLTF